LVVSTILKNMSSSMGRIIPYNPIYYGKSWNSCSKPPTSSPFSECPSAPETLPLASARTSPSLPREALWPRGARETPVALGGLGWKKLQLNMFRKGNKGFKHLTLIFFCRTYYDYNHYNIP
jgi:hypothetical protein